MAHFLLSPYLWNLSGVVAGLLVLSALAAVQKPRQQISCAAP
jgi:hypothetical protein